VLDTKSSIAGVLKDLGKYNEALTLYRAVEQVCRVDRGARPGKGWRPRQSRGPLGPEAP